jgi:hypothetical protein
VIILRHLTFVLLGLWLVFPAQAEEAYRKLPWHLVNIHWTMEAGVEAEEFHEFTLDVSLENDPGESLRFYISPFTFNFLNGPLVYGGLQTHVGKLPPNRQRGIIFSRWGERREDFIRHPPDGAWESAGYEGNFISTRAPLAWRAGQHQMRLSRHPAAKPTDAPGHWVGFSFCLEMVECRSAGELGFAEAKPRMPRHFISFVEIYGKEANLANLKNFSVTFARPKLNGRPVRIERLDALFPPDIPAIAKVRRVDPFTVRIEIGESDRRESFRIDKNNNKIQSLP